MPPAFLYGLIGYCDKEPHNVNTIALEDVSASVTLRGFVAHITSTLRYRNGTQQPLQVVFKTPVDEGSALYHVQAKLDDRTIVAKCLEKKKAETVYKDAVEAGQTAMLVREESQASDIINLALGNLPAGAVCEVTLSLVAELRVGGDGGVQFTLPTVLNPRYQPASSTGPDAFVASNVTPVATASKPYSIEVAASVSGALDIARIISHSDPINVVIDDDNKSAKISQDGGYRSDHEWSFDVHYNNPYSPQVLVETGDPTATGLMKDQVLMINMFPELPESSYSRFNEVIFVVDRSGSMDGENIQSARAVLMLFLKSLPPGCRFNIVCFGSSHFFLFQEGSRVYSEETLAEACALHDKMGADMGGTEILQPLKAIYSKPVDPEFSRQLLLLTDGQVWNTDEVTELAARYASSTRVFTVGIGDGASTALVKGLARAGRGRAEMVTQRDRMSTKVMGLVASMLQSSVRGVSISCELEPPSRLSLVPPEPPVIFAGQQLVTFARMPPGTQLKGVTLKGKVDGQEWQSSVEGSQVLSVHDASYALHRLAARAAILHLCLHEQDNANEEIVRLSVAANVLSPCTAFVAVDQDSKHSRHSMMGPHFSPIQPAKSINFSFTNRPIPQGNSSNLFQGPSLFNAAPQSNQYRSGGLFGSYCPQNVGHSVANSFDSISSAQLNAYGSSTLFGAQSGGSNSSSASLAAFGSQVCDQHFTFGSTESVGSKDFVQQRVFQSAQIFGSPASVQQNTSRSPAMFELQAGTQQTNFGSSVAFDLLGRPNGQQNVPGSSTTFGSHPRVQLCTSGSMALGSQPNTPVENFASSKTLRSPFGTQQNTFGSSTNTSFGSDAVDVSQNSFRFGSQQKIPVTSSDTHSIDKSPASGFSFKFGLQTTEHLNTPESSFRFGTQPTESQSLSSSSMFFGSKTNTQLITTPSPIFGTSPSVLSSQGVSHQSKHQIALEPATHTVSDTHVASFNACDESSKVESKREQSTFPSQKQDGMLRIIQLQSFDGSWSIEDILGLSMIGQEEMDDLRKLEADATALATAFAVAFLQERFCDMAREWTLLVKKAQNFLEKRIGDKNAEVLVKRIQNFLRTMKSAAI